MSIFKKNVQFVFIKKNSAMCYEYSENQPGSMNI